MRPELDAAFSGLHPIEHYRMRKSHPEEKLSQNLVRFALKVLRRCRSTPQDQASARASLLSGIAFQIDPGDESVSYRQQRGSATDMLLTIPC